MHINFLYMSKTIIRTKTKILVLLLWTLLAALSVAAVLWPVYANNINYTFYFNNILFIIVFIFLIRYLFFIKYTFISGKIAVKILIIVLAIIFDIYAYSALNEFIDFYQENGKYFALEHLPVDKQYDIGDFIFKEYIFFGVAALVSGIIIPFRLLVSIWHVYNKGREH